MSAKPRATRRSQHALVRLSGTSLQCLRRSLELIERITPGNCSHHKGNIRVMLKAVLDDVESPNIGMNESPSHQPSMTSEQLDRFQDWLNREAVEANNKSGAYFNGRACAFNDAFECLTIFRMKASQTPESTESDKSPNASGSATAGADGAENTNKG